MVRKVFVAAVSAASALVMGFGTPAIAEPYSAVGSVPVGPENGYWNWSNLSLLSLASSGNDTWENNSGVAVTWDGTLAFLYGTDDSVTTISCDIPADLSDATDGSDDVILTCDPQAVDNGDGELTVRSEFRFFADGKTVRRRYILTNETDATISGQKIQIDFDAYQDEKTVVSYTDLDGFIGDWSTDYAIAGSHVITAENYIWVTDDRVPVGRVAVVKYAVGQSTSAAPLLDIEGYSSGNMGDEGEHSRSFYAIPELDPGDTVEFVALAKIYLFDNTLDEDPAYDGWAEGTKLALDLAVADTDLESAAYVFAGIDEPARVVNWGDSSGAANSGGSGLASTGFDWEPFGSVALFAAAGGLALFVRRGRPTR